MPDRYGDQPDDTDDFGPAYRQRAQAVAECDLCDPDGTRNGFACDHIDHRAEHQPPSHQGAACDRMPTLRSQSPERLPVPTLHL